MKGVVALSFVVLGFSLGCSSSQPLLNGRDLTGWVEVGSTGSWSVSEGVLKCSGQKDGYAWLSTARKYGDFELTLDWRIEPKGNSGIFCRAPSREGRTSMKGFEIQIKDDAQDKDLTDVTGAVFRRIPALDKFAKPPGNWNHYKITCRARQLRIELNGRLVSDTDMNAVEAIDKDTPMSAVPDEGYIGLQNHGDPAEFRNIRIREIR